MCSKSSYTNVGQRREVRKIPIFTSFAANLSSPLFKYLVNYKYFYFDAGTEIIKPVDEESLDNRNIQRE